MTCTFDIVIPTVGRSSLDRLLGALAQLPGPTPGKVVIVDDRPAATDAAIRRRVPRRFGSIIHVLNTRGAGPAMARNAGWRVTSAPWVVFLDDDVVPTATWARDLVDDLERATADVVGIQGRVMVPLPSSRRPTDWERNVAGLERGRWITADMAYRRAALEEVGGFDARFPRPYREDSDLGLRIVRRGGHVVGGHRSVVHPPGKAGFWKSVSLQKGNQDDALMTALHGREWRRVAGAPAGRFGGHVVTVVAAATGLAGLLLRYRRLARAGAVVWAVAWLEFSWARIAPGPRDLGEVVRMLATSAAIPPVAVVERVKGHMRARSLHRDLHMNHASENDARAEASA